MCNNYLQDTATKKSVIFSVKTYNNLKTIDIVYIKRRLLLRMINLMFSTVFSHRRM